MRIICCGNPDRGDDGAGLFVAARLRELGIPAETCRGEAAELMEAWKWASDVTVVDAVMTGATAGTVHCWDENKKFPVQSSASTHGLGLCEAIALARALGSLPARLRVYGIEANQFEPGIEVSLAVRRAAETLASMIAAEVAV
jgi:hydrogenase maturation protease